MTEKTEPTLTAERLQQRQYVNFLKKYQQTVNRIKAIQKRYPVPGDPEVLTKIENLDKERHETHMQLLDVGKSLAKNEADVLIDIIRQNRTLQDYGLPEFSLFTSDDVVYTGYWHDLYEFNIDPKAKLPHPNVSKKWKEKGERRAVENQRDLDDEAKERLEGRPKGIASDECMLVFAIVPVAKYGEFEDEPDDYSVRIRRAEKLAQELGTTVFEERDSDYHNADAKVLGVVFPKTEFEKVCTLIRDNPEEYRLGTDFYSDTDKKELREFVVKKEPAREKYRLWLEERKREGREDQEDE